MLENQGNPESGIDQFLAQQAPAEPTLEELKAKVNKLEEDLSWCRSGRQAYIDTVNKVTKHIQDSIDREEWSDEELSEVFWEELADMLDIELSKTVEVIIKAEWSATLRLPRSMSVDSALEDISIEEPSVDSYGKLSLEDVYERDCDIREA